MIVLGRIVAPFGIKGWVHIAPQGDDPESWADMSQWWIGRDADAPEEAWTPLPLRGHRIHGAGLVVHFEGYDDRTAAETLKGALIAAPREALPEPDEDEWYWADLVGLKVVTLADEPLGTVAGLLTTGVHDVLRVVEDKQERLIPFVAAYAKEVDTDAGLIRVDWDKDW